ncbi:MAG: hypothetical protein ACD_15C00146G0001 [uncultured bacterium]|nr:MAG: hypothetical protein ACD_15C00146G0001 [uncultured bacterium]KKT89204.1 MAG: hypothetical protein UW87_C0007G0014 [Candidatus Moranbacteria bacterium GW2011_GWC2_45_10]KKT95508.1 MAG: hypothetical protein UW95_C0001G0072 [Parcubacteria group bacterium GW2011_GWC1_45_14]HAV11330.1 hypothetical protein [Candidatus Moranbacteria bacterium]
MNTIILILSKKEPYLDGAALIQSMCNSKEEFCTILFIEDILLNDNFVSFNWHGKVIYFLTNSLHSGRYISFLENFPCHIINKTFLSGEKSKFCIQQRIKRSGLSVPESISANSINSLILAATFLKFPAYAKSQQQATFTQEFYNKQSFFNFINTLKNDEIDFYLEESMNAPNRVLIKFYYINGFLINNPQNYAPPMSAIQSIKKDLSILEQALKLNVFSFDLILCKKTLRYWFIDINPASAFFGSEKARFEFVKHLNKTKDDISLSLIPEQIYTKK